MLDQWRTCWGWMLDRGHRTVLEVFDERWSHCHQWSAGPTWQLSRYLLGLHPREDLGRRHLDLRHRPGSVTTAAGMFPRADGCVRVEWEAPALHIEVDAPITLHLEDGRTLEVERSLDVVPG